MLILGRKNSEREDEHWAYKGRPAFQGSCNHTADGARVFGVPDGLYGKPVDLGLARASIAVSMLRDWRVEAGDIEGAYLAAVLRRPPVYMKLSRELWGAVGVPAGVLQRRKEPCVKLESALYGITKARA